LSPCPLVSPSPRRRFAVSARAFSLVEVLLAVFILGIGMIMVASVFPVGATWTRQTAEESIAQTVAQNALSVLQTTYGTGGAMHDRLAPDFLSGPAAANPANLNSILKSLPPSALPSPPPGPFVLQAFPNFTNIPPSERAYQFGSTNPFPAANPQVCTYFWTALVRLNPAHRGLDPNTNFVQLSSTYNYDVYILVFRKGAANHYFSPVPPVSSLPSGATYLEIPNMRGAFYPFDEGLIPSVGYAGWLRGQYAASQSPPIHDALPGIGQYGIGVYSGTVFRQVVDPNPSAPALPYQCATPPPFLIGGEPVIFSPAPDAAASSASPLIYIYQTTMSF